MIIKKYKQFIFEKMGIPDNIVESGEELYEYYLELLIKYKRNIAIGNSFSLGKMDVKVGELSFRIKLNVVIGSSNKILIDGGAITMISTGVDSGTILYEYDKRKSEFDLTINYGMEYGDSVDEFIDFNRSKSTILKSIFTHELKHLYDLYIKGKSDIERFTDYSFSKTFDFNLTEVKKFIFNVYYTNGMEDLVRTSEVFAMIRADKVTKPEFYTYLKGLNIYKRLKLCRDYSYSEMRAGLLEERDMLLNVLEYNSLEYDKDNDDDIIDKFMVLLTDEIKLNLSRQYSKISNQTGMWDINRSNKYYSKLNDNIIERTIKNVNRTADRTLKRISKLYDMCSDLEEL